MTKLHAPEHFILHELDLEPIMVKCMDAEEGYGWTLTQVQSAAMNYRRFLILNLKHPGNSIVPSKTIDKIWHMHILDTMKYPEDCEKALGRFLHHFPYFGMRGEADAANLHSTYEATCALWEKEFGVDLLASNAYCLSDEPPCSTDIEMPKFATNCQSGCTNCLSTPSGPSGCDASQCYPNNLPDQAGSAVHRFDRPRLQVTA